MTGRERLAYSVEEAAEQVGMNKMTIYRAVKAGDLPSYRPTKKITILHTDLMAWVTTDRKSA